MGMELVTPFAPAWPGPRADPRARSSPTSRGSTGAEVVRAQAGPTARSARPSSLVRYAGGTGWAK